MNVRSKLRSSWRWLGIALLASAISVSSASAPRPAAADTGPVLGGALPGPLPLFPPDNWWNTDVSAVPLDPGSAGYIAFINNGGTRRLHPDLGGTVSPGSAQIYGMPYGVVDGTQPKLTVFFRAYPDESDGVGVPFYPIPTQAISPPHWVEGGDPATVDRRGSEDRHLIIVDRDNKILYELYHAYYNTGTQQWEADSGARFDMKTNDRRPDGWTSADAAGLAILPGLLRYDEVYDGAVTEIQHALRVTVRATNGYVYPASHRAGSTAGALPMGARLRLKASKDISGFTPEVQKIFRAMKRYGLIVADNGSDMYIGGTFDVRWDNDVLNPAFSQLTASDFEVVQLGWKPDTPPPPPPPPTVSALGVSPSSVQSGQGATGTVTLGAPAPTGGPVVALSSANPAVASVPASTTVTAGATSATFSVSTSTVSVTTVVSLTASLGGTSKSVAITVNPAPPPPVSPSSLSLSPSTIRGGQSSTGTVRLSAAAPSGGVVVSLVSSRPAQAAVPATVTVAAGQASATFTVSTPTAPANTSAVITAGANGVSRSATLTIKRTR